MKNFVSALAATLSATVIMYLMRELEIAQYADVPDPIAYVLSSGSTLVAVEQGLAPINSIIVFFPIWIAMGAVMGPLSKPGWNTVRSTIWLGTILGILSISSILYVTPVFWYLPERNLQLFTIFASSILLAQVTLITALPSALVIERLRLQSEPPIPDTVETVCACGAVYKSKPLICSACGRPLNTSPVDETTGHA